MSGFIYRFGWFFNSFFGHSFWRVPGKISFSSYMMHNFVVQLVLMEVYQPIMLDGLKFVSTLQSEYFNQSKTCQF